MDLHDSLARLREEYIATFPEKRAQFEGWARRIEAGEGALRDLDPLCTLAHRLAGSAGTHGFDDVAAAAVRLESVIESANADTVRRPAFREALLERIADLCGQLERTLDTR